MFTANRSDFSGTTLHAVLQLLSFMESMQLCNIFYTLFVRNNLKVLKKYFFWVLIKYNLLFWPSEQMLRLIRAYILLDEYFLGRNFRYSY